MHWVADFVNINDRKSMCVVYCIYKKLKFSTICRNDEVSRVLVQNQEKTIGLKIDDEFSNKCKILLSKFEPHPFFYFIFKENQANNPTKTPSDKKNSLSNKKENEFLKNINQCLASHSIADSYDANYFLFLIVECFDQLHKFKLIDLSFKIIEKASLFIENSESKIDGISTDEILKLRDKYI